MKKYFFSLFGKQHEIQNKLLAYIEHTEAMALDMEKAVGAYLSLDQPEFSKIRARIDEMEHRLDLLRREIEEEIYGRHLLPDTRGDILVLLESIDKIPNRIQALTREMALQRVQVPEILHPSLRNLVERDVKIVQVMSGAARAFLDKPDQVKPQARELSYYEHEGDLIEQEAVALTFADNSLQLAHQLQLHRLIDDLGSICDIAEDVGDRLVIAALKRIL